MRRAVVADTIGWAAFGILAGVWLTFFVLYLASRRWSFLALLLVASLGLAICFWMLRPRRQQ